MLATIFFLTLPPSLSTGLSRAKANSTKSPTDGIVSYLGYLFPDNVLPGGYGSGNMLEGIKVRLVSYYSG